VQAQAERASRRFARQREAFDQQAIVEGPIVANHFQLCTQRACAGEESIVIERLELLFAPGDRGDQWAIVGERHGLDTRSRPGRR
jgi:hypothetical protein